MYCSRGLEDPCHMIVPEFEKLLQDYSGTNFVEMDFDAPFHRRIFLCVAATSTCILLFFMDGQKVDELKLRLGKAKQIPALREKVQSFFN